MKIVTAAQVKEIDRRCEDNGVPTSILMENAGKAVAGESARILGDINRKHIVVLAGPGNNGGDGLVAARYLHEWGADIHLYLFGKKRKNDRNLELVRERTITCTEVMGEEDLNGLDSDLVRTDAVIDAMFGVGSNRPLGGVYRLALQKTGRAVKNNPEIHIIALDVPSGMNADTGMVDEVCLHADDTVTLGFPKTGLYQHPGMEMAGRVSIMDIGIPSRLEADISRELNDAERVRQLLPSRPLNSNKGTFGKVLVVAGSINYIGAAYLACAGAMRAGAGIVTLATAESLQPVVASKLTEATWLPLPESGRGIISPSAVTSIQKEIEKYDVLLAGCGLGQSEPVKEFITLLLTEEEMEIPVTVLDADALNILSTVPDWWRRITGSGILTPHPGEMARLRGMTVEAVQQARLKTAEDAAAEWGKAVVLKGACTIVASPKSTSVISPVANPGMASAGTGDVLAGVIAGLAAQKMKPSDAASCGVYIHAAAGELVREILGDAGIIASDLLPALPLAIKKLKETG